MGFGGRLLDKSNGHVFLRGDTGKCLHYYFYFIDEEFGLCYLRVPTWAPFGLQFYCNGHSALAIALQREGIDFVQEDNAFLRVADLKRAQALADSFNPRPTAPAPDALRALAVPRGRRVWPGRLALEHPPGRVSTDLMFRSREILVPLYDAISRQAVLAADAPRVAGLPGQEGHADACPGDRLAAVHSHRGPLHQTLHGRSGREGLRQVLPRAARGDHCQRRQLFQAPPQGGTQGRATHARAGTVEEVDSSA